MAKRFSVVDDNIVLVDTNDKDFAFSTAHSERNRGRRGVRIFERDYTGSGRQVAQREVFPDYTAWVVGVK